MNVPSAIKPRSRQTRALVFAALVAVLLLAPIAYMRYLDARYDADGDTDFGPPAPFLVVDDAGKPLSRADFDGNLSIVAWLADACPDARPTISRCAATE